MRIVFAGTPAFAAVALQALIEARFDVVLVLTQPDRPSGRGLRNSPSDVKRVALHHGLLLAQPQSLRDEGVAGQLRSTAAQAMVVAAYGLILPLTILDLFPVGCVNIHASLLPRWRGAAPIQRALLAGDSETGISIMRMEQGLDTGPVYLTRTAPIFPNDSAGSLHDRLAELGAISIVETLPQIAAGTLAPAPQPNQGITYAHKITKGEGKIDWKRDAMDIERQIRAFNPFPGAFSMLGGEPVKIWQARAIVGQQGVPGQILGCGPHGIDVACGNGALQISELQKAGSRRLPAADFQRGASLKPGEHFAS